MNQTRADFATGGFRARPCLWVVVLLSSAWIGGCGNQVGQPFPDDDGLSFPLAISVLTPRSDAILRGEETFRIEWIDTGMEPGATITLRVVFTDDDGAEARAVILTGRDALRDGDADVFEWNGTTAGGKPLAARSYQVEATMINPDGSGVAGMAVGQVRIPFSFVGVGPVATNTDLRNNSGLGPFELVDANADFVDDGVKVGDSLHVEGGSGTVIGIYDIISVSPTVLRLRSNAGDSAGEADVRYLVDVAAPVLRQTTDLVTIAWRDQGIGTPTAIDLEVDPDLIAENGNAVRIRENIGLGQDGVNDRFVWDGTDTSGVRVPPGRYFVRAVVSPVGEVPFSYMTPNRISLGGIAPSIELTQPSTTRMPDAGVSVVVRWTDSDPDDDAQITIFVDPDTDAEDPGHDSGNELIIQSGIDEDDGEDAVTWETAGFPGGPEGPITYTVVGRIEDSEGNVAMSSAPGSVTLKDSPPVLHWVRPEGTSADVENNNGSGPFRLTDASAGFSTKSLRVRDLVFAGNAVRIIDGTDAAKGETIVDEDPSGPTELLLQDDPGDSDSAGDVEYRVTGDVHLIRGSNPKFDFETHDPEQSDASFKLFLDFDDVDDNGNEVQILADRAMPVGTVAQDDSFTWTNTVDLDGLPITPAVYRLYAEMDDGVPRTPLPKSVFEGMVILQPGLDEPTIIINFPDRDFSPNLNQKIAIRWGDENTDDNTRITIRFDDDPTPNESTETGDPELTIQADVPADPDPGDPGTSGNPDETQWDWHSADITEPAVPAGDYFIFGYIGNNGDPLISPDLVAIVPFIATIRNTAPELEFSNPGAAGGEFPSPSGGNIVWNERDADEDTVTIELWLDPDDTFSEDLNREIQIATSDDVASLADAPVFPWGGPGRSFPWDGLDSSGQSVETGAYRLVAVLNDSTNGDVTVEATGLVNFRPDANSAVILMASQFVSSSVGTEGNVNISYRTIPVTGSETVELYFDNDNDPTDDLGTEIEPLESKPSDANVLHTFAWDLGAKDPEVAAGTYFIHARLMDGAVEKDVSTSRASIEVTGQTVTPTFDFLRPLLNGLDVVSGTDNVNIEWEYASSQTGTLSLEADPDTNSGNNNEILILSNRVLDPAPDGVSASFDWDLTDTGGADVPTGTYLIRGRFVVTSALARIADGTVRVRKSASAPLVAFTQPTGNTNYINGETPDRDILIRWDVDPLEPNPDVRVDIWFDREPSPEADAGILTEGEPLSGLTGLGITSGIIVEDLDASQGVFDWTAQLQPEFLTNVDTTWYIHIRIRDGALPADDDRATAVGTIRVN